MVVKSPAAAAESDPLAEAVGLTVANLSVLKNDRAKAVRFSTLTRICLVLGCSPGDVFSLAPPAG